MKPEEIARWALKFKKKGLRGAVDNAPPPPQPGRPTEQAWGQPYRQQPGGMPTRGSTWGARPPELETLVKPGASAYPEILAGVPELYPEGSSPDAMEGPLTQEQEMARREALLGEYYDPGVRPEDPRDAVPRAYRGVGGGHNIAPLAELPRTAAAADAMLTNKPN